jgi:hypothetical protein
MNIPGINFSFFNGKPDGVFYIGNDQGTAAGIRMVIDAPEIRMNIIPVSKQCLTGQWIFLLEISTPGMQGNN